MGGTQAKVKMVNTDNLLFNVAAFVSSLFLLEYGADKFVDHTAAIAKRWKVSPTLIGLLTCGAEWEEVREFVLLTYQLRIPTADQSVPSSLLLYSP